MSPADSLGAVFRIAGRALDPAVSPDAIRGYLLERLGAALAEPARWPLEARPDLEHARAAAAAAGLTEAGDRPPPREPPPGDPLRVWFEALPLGKVVSRGRIHPGVGRALLARLETQPRARRQATDPALESLLRHVETLRERSLRTDPPLDRAAAWLERHDVAILFARAARRRRDLRLLNAALKLNDLSFRAHRRAAPGAPAARYLWALAEQERAQAELLP